MPWRCARCVGGVGTLGTAIGTIVFAACCLWATEPVTTGARSDVDIICIKANPVRDGMQADSGCFLKASLSYKRNAAPVAHVGTVLCRFDREGPVFPVR